MDILQVLRLNNTHSNLFPPLTSSSTTASTPSENFLTALEPKLCGWLGQRKKICTRSKKQYPSWKLTWNLKITQLKRKIIFQTSIFGFHVSFRGAPFLKLTTKAPENGCLEDFLVSFWDGLTSFLLGYGLFSGANLFSGGKLACC